MQPPQIEDQAALERALGADLYLLFKHSPVCPVSARAFEQVRAFLGSREGLATGWLDVIAQRPLSQWVAARTGIAHQSPQALLFRGGEPVWHANHYGITAEAIEKALGTTGHG